MPQFLKVESFESEKPIVLVFGEGPLVNSLIEKFSSFLKIICITKKLNNKNENVFQVPQASARSILRLKERIDYAVILLEKSDDTKIVNGFLEKLSKNQTKTSVIIPVNSFSNLNETINSLKGEKNLSFEVIGDTFGNETPNTDISKIIGNVITNGTIFLSEDDALPIYTISFDDALNSIYFSLFSEKKREKINLLFYENPSDYISLVHSLRRNFSDLEIDFNRNLKPNTNPKTQSEFRRKIEESTHTKTSYVNTIEGFEREIKKFADNFDRRKNNKIHHTGIFREHSSLSIKKVGLGIMLVLLFIFVSSFISLVAGGLFLKKTLANFENYNFAKAKANSSLAKYLIAWGKPSVITIDIPLSLTLGKRPAEEKYETLERSANLLNLVSIVAPDLLGIGKGIKEEKLQNLIGKINYIYDEAEHIKAKTGHPVLEKYINQDSSRLLSILGTLPELLGFRNNKNYLLLFQNNGELRPTGGFIGSVGELSISKGKIKNLNIRDVYELDGQLKAHIEPHYIVRRYLQPHMYLRDSNFDPDFSKSASFSALLYNFESGKKADGVVGIDFEVMRRIIKAVGPIKIKEYNKTIDENSVFSFLQNTIEGEFFPGSSQKRDILNSLFNQITLILENDKGKLLKVASLIPPLLSEKHILLYSYNRATEQVFLVNDFGGGVRDFRNKNKYGIYDFLSINEANIGVNKANVNVTRKVEYMTTLSNSKNVSKVTLTLNNASDKLYRSYTRIITPLGSKFNSIKVDGKTLTTTPAITDFITYESPSFTIPEELELEETTEGDIKTFGFILKVPGKKSQTIEFSYDNGSTPLGKTYSTYSLLYIKQSGTLEYPLTVKLEAPKDFGLKNNGVLFNGEVKNAVLFSGEIKSDKEFQTTLIKK